MDTKTETNKLMGSYNAMNDVAKREERMYEKIFERIVAKDGSEGIRLKKDYLRYQEIQTLRVIIVFLGGKFLPRINMWSMHKNNILRFESILDGLKRQVDARIELGYSSGGERSRLEAVRRLKVQSSRVLKSAIYKDRGPYCEGCGGKRQVRYRIVPISVGGTDELKNFRVLCKSCQSKIRLYTNKCVAEELLKKDPNWFFERYDDAVTAIVDGEI